MPSENFTIQKTSGTYNGSLAGTSHEQYTNGDRSQTAAVNGMDGGGRDTMPDLSLPKPLCDGRTEDDRVRAERKTHRYHEKELIENVLNITLSGGTSVSNLPNQILTHLI